MTKSSKENSFKQDLIQGLSYIRRARGLLTLAFLATSLNFLITPFSTLLPYFVKFDHLGSATELAVVIAFLQGGILAGGLIMSVKKEFKRKVATALGGIVVSLSGYALVALTPRGQFWFMGLSALVFALSIPVANVLLQTLMQIVVPLDMQGRVNSVTMALSMAATPAGTLISGAVVEFTATSNLFIGCSLSGILITALSWLFTDVRRVETLSLQEESKSDSNNPNRPKD